MREECFHDDDEDVDDTEEGWLDEPCAFCGATDEISTDPHGEATCESCFEANFL